MRACIIQLAGKSESQRESQREREGEKESRMALEVQSQAIVGCTGQKRLSSKQRAIAVGVARAKVRE